MKVYVVTWNGDEDCSGRNDGPVAVFTSQLAAEQYAMTDGLAEVTKRNDGGPPKTSLTTVRWTGEAIVLTFPVVWSRDLSVRGRPDGYGLDRIVALVEGMLKGI